MEISLSLTFLFEPLPLGDVPNQGQYHGLAGLGQHRGGDLHRDIGALFEAASTFPGRAFRVFRIVAGELYQGFLLPGYDSIDG